MVAHIMHYTFRVDTQSWNHGNHGKIWNLANIGKIVWNGMEFILVFKIMEYGHGISFDKNCYQISMIFINLHLFSEKFSPAAQFIAEYFCILIKIYSRFKL